MMRLLPAAKPTALLVVIEFIRMEDVPLVQPQRRRRRRRRHVALLCDVTVVVHKGAAHLFPIGAAGGDARARERAIPPEISCNDFPRLHCRVAHQKCGCEKLTILIFVFSLSTVTCGQFISRPQTFVYDQ